MTSVRVLILLPALAILCLITSVAQQTTFRNAPATAAEKKNPLAGNAQAVTAGKKLYAQNCSQCHGNHLQGMGPAPAVDSALVRNAQPGALFWFITNGKPASGMPSWAILSDQQRWKLVSFLQAKKAAVK